MKKLVFPFLVVFALSFANALDKVEFNDCHAEACAEVGAWEDEFGELDEHFVEQVYQAAFEECEG